MIQNCNMSKVAKVFFDQPTEKHYLREISGKSSLAHTSVMNYLIALKKEYVIKESVEKRGGRDYPFYTANTGSESYRKQKVVSNLSDLLGSGLVEYIRDATMPDAIILFGSRQPRLKRVFLSQLERQFLGVLGRRKRRRNVNPDSVSRAPVTSDNDFLRNGRFDIQEREKFCLVAGKDKLFLSFLIKVYLRVHGRPIDSVSEPQPVVPREQLASQPLAP